MFKKFFFVIAAVLTSVCAFATAPQSKIDGVEHAFTGTLDTAAIAGKQATVKTAPTAEKLGDALFKPKGDAVKSFSLAKAKPVPIEAPVYDFTTTAATSGTLSASARSPHRAAGKVVTGSLFTNDLNYKGVLYSSRIEIAKTGGEDDKAYAITNIYGTGATISATIDEAAGTVTIPYQKVTTVSGMGDVMICPMSFTGGKASYSKTDLVGTIDADGVITLPGWGLLITEGENAGKGYNFFMSSTWSPANATVTAYDIIKEQNVEYRCLIKQQSDNSLTFYGLSGVTAEVLNSRLTAGKEVLIPNTLVYNNQMYGEFYIYPYDVASQKTLAGSNLKGVYADGTIDFAAWAIASRQYPTLYVGYKYSGIKVKPDFEITFPVAEAFNAEGAGTADSPYLIKTVEQFTALATNVNGGTDYNGTHFALAADLDFSSVQSVAYQPVGDIDTPFNGTFDGAGHTVKGLNVSNYSYATLGLFGRLGVNATVKNINIEGFRLSSAGTYVAALAAFCEGKVDNITVTSTSITGNCDMAAGIVAGARGCTITNATFQGSLTGNGSVAAIASQAADATITNCHSRANIQHNGYLSSTCRDAAGLIGAAIRTTIKDCSTSGMIQDVAGFAVSGGLIGRLLDESTVNSSFTTMVINATANSSMTTTSPINCYQGGLFGYINNAVVRDCYSSSYIFQNTAVGATYCGGLIGYLSVAYSFSTTEGSQMKNLSHLYNCYFSGQVYSAATESSKNIYGSTYHLDSWTGELPENLAFHNCYYDSQIALVAGDDMGRPTSFFTTSMPEGFDAAVWKVEAGRYPVIAALADSQASELSSAPLTLADGQNATKVTRNFTITPLTNVTWGISGDDAIVQDNGSIAISGSDVTIKDKYSTSVIVAQSKDNWGMKLYRLAIVPKWFDGEGTAENPYQIKTADDFIKLDAAVGTHAQPHVGDYFKVMNDIDFTGSTFQGVAAGMNSNRPFGGTLDGDGHALHNLIIDGIVEGADGNADQTASRSFAGLFSLLSQTAVVKNLNIAADCKFRGYSYVGAIAGASFGRIENCRNYAMIAAAGSYAGGITGYATKGADVSGYDYKGAVVERCYNAGSVAGSYSNYGGIVGFANAEVSLCQNDADVTAFALVPGLKNVQVNSLGGIAGQSYGTIDRCVNNATVSGYYSVGGIVGTSNDASVTASVNNGFVNMLSDDVRRGGIIGGNTSYKTIENNYYDSSLNINGAANNGGIGGATGLSSVDMTSGNQPEGLSADDYDFAAGKYPVLKAFAAEAATVALRSMVVQFGNGQIRTNALEPVTLSKETDWTLKEGTNFKITDNVLSVTFPADLSVPVDTLTGVKDGMTKVLPISAIPVILKGEGTAESPYLIETTEDWNKLSDFMLVNKYEYNGKHFLLVNDLDFKGDSIRLLAVNGVKFEAEFNGNGKTISNYVYSNPNSVATVSRWVGPNLYRGVNIGLFGTIGAEGVVKDLTANGKFEAVNNIGGIAGDVYGKLINVTHKGTISNTSSSNIGGIASKVFDGGSLTGCVNEGSVTAKTTNACGIVVTANVGSTVEGCVNNGKVKSTTTGAYGIANTVSGKMIKCVNHGQLLGTGTAAGICGTLSKTGVLEECYNDADINYGTTGGNLAGVVYNTSDQTAAGTTEPTSWIKKCYNTGKIYGKNNVFGFSYNIKKGVLVEDCYNTGDVTAAGTNASFGFTAAITSNNAENLVPTQIRRCWNGGNVTSTTVASQVAAGFAKSVAAGTIIEDCYNLGDVTVKAQATSKTQICCAVGFIGTISGGHISRCWNAGTVYGLTPCNAGIAGYISGTNCTTLEECFNLGDVTGSSLLANGDAGNANGTAGGLFGYISIGNPVIRNCYNAGTVTGNNRVGGLAGGMFRPDAIVENCYNSGKVVCENTWWSGTIYTSSENYGSGDTETSYFANSKNVFYDADIVTGTEYRNFPGSAKTTAEMAALNISEAFETVNGYPVLKSLNAEGTAAATLDASRVSTAMILVADGDSYSNVTKELTLAADPSVKWTVTGDGELTINGSTAYPTKIGKVTVTASNADDTMQRSFELDLKAIASSIDGIDANGKTIVSTIYVDPAGRIVPVPTAGQPYVVRITYADGTSTVRKVVTNK